jgi:hypothetical protein
MESRLAELAGPAGLRDCTVLKCSSGRWVCAPLDAKLLNIGESAMRTRLGRARLRLKRDWKIHAASIMRHRRLQKMLERKL